MWARVRSLCRDLIEKLLLSFPQTNINGPNNLWIVKPAGLSRGRKIRLFNDLQQIMDYTEVDPQVYNAALL